MKKKRLTVLAIFLIVALCVSLWFYGYYSRKSNDNLPSLTKIAEMEEADVNSLLPGYKIQQLREVWGEPDYSEENEAVWQIGNVKLIVNFKSDGEIAICCLEAADG